MFDEDKKSSNQDKSGSGQPPNQSKLGSGQIQQPKQTSQQGEPPVLTDQGGQKPPSQEPTPPPSIPATPAEPTPVEPAAPAEPTTPAEPAPAEPAPAQPAEPTPAEPTPAEPTPAEPAPQEPAEPAEPPAQPAPAEPVEPPAQPAPAEAEPAPKPDTTPPAEVKPPAIETPELAKKEIIQKAEEAGAPSKEKIHTMPEKFKKIRPKFTGGKGKSNVLILGILIFLLLVGGGAGFYLWMQGYYQAPETITEEETPSKEEVSLEDQPIIEQEELLPEQEKLPDEELAQEQELVEEEVPEEPSLSPPQNLIAELRGETDEELTASAELKLPVGAVDLDTQVELTGESVTQEMKQEPAFQQSPYEIIGPIYKVNPSDISFNTAVTLKVFYHEDLIDQEWESDLSLGYFKDDLWTPLPTFLDTENNILIVDFEILPADTLSIIVDKESLIPKIEAFQIAPNIPPSVDSDNDGLTDVEDIVFSTEVNNPDSDADGNPDGQEIIGLMHPLSSDEAKLATSGLINVYTNPTYSYSFFYPASWLARAIPETGNQEVLVITNTGEFFSITVENNPERLMPVDWYVKQSPDTDKNLLFETIVNNESAVWNPEHLTVYVTKDDRVYILSYNVGTEKHANFKTIFEMIINSFQFVVQPQGRPNGTLIKYFDLPEVYRIENGKKRAFKSGEIFERLGFNWEDVIEIPLSETYLDGDIITGRLNGTLIKYPDSPGIYLIENGKKRAFKSGEIFENLDYKWEDVIEIPPEEIYPDGPIIESGY